MTRKMIVIYDLKGKSQTQKVQVLRKLYGYRDKSNYDYKYNRTGKLRNIQFSKEKKIILTVHNKTDVSRVVKIFKDLKIDFEVAKI